MTDLCARRPWQQRLRRRIPTAILSVLRFVVLLGLSYVFLFPVLYMISVAFRAPDSVNDPSVIWIPRALSLQSLRETVALMHYGHALMKTLAMTVPSTLAAVLSCSVIGYGFARYDFLEKKAAFLLVVLTIIVPPQMIVLSSYTNFRYFTFAGLLRLLALIPGVPASVNLLDTPWTFILPSLFGVGLRGGFFIFIYRQFFLGMPRELEEAAYIDGCSPFATFRRIMFPLAKPAIIIVLLFSLVWHWNDTRLSAMYYMNDMPLSVMLSNLKTLIVDSGVTVQSNDMVRTYMQAGCLLTITPPLLLYLVAQRYFTESVERAGIVG